MKRKLQVLALVLMVLVAGATLSTFPVLGMGQGASSIFYSVTTTILNITGPLTASNVNNVVYVSQGGYADIGQAVNAAFAAAPCAGVSGTPTRGCIVNIVPGTYSYSTSIVIPDQNNAPYVFNPVLDCQGANLNWTGTSGYAIHVKGGNDELGQMRNCYVNGTGPGVATTLVYMGSRNQFTFTNNFLQNAQYCMVWDDTTSDGGVGYSEENVVRGLHTNFCQEHWALRQSTGGTGSFFYNRVYDWYMAIGDGTYTEKGWDLEAGSSGTFSTQGFILENLNVNTESNVNPIYVIYIDGGNSIYRSVVNITGENSSSNPTAYGIYVNQGGYYANGRTYLSGFANLGFSVNPANYPGTGTQQWTGVLNQQPAYQSVTSNSLYPGGFYATRFIPETNVGGGFPSRICKSDINVVDYALSSHGSNDFYLANEASESDCHFALWSRHTSGAAGDSDVDIDGNTNIVSMLYAEPLHSAIGFGPGWGQGTLPLYSIDNAGQLRQGATGTAITQIQLLSLSLTPAATAANTCVTQSLTAGLNTSPLANLLSMHPPSGALPTGLSIPNYWTDSTGKIDLQICNNTAGSLTAPSGTYTILAEW